MIRKNIIYIGGVHGVGKDTICEVLERNIGFKHLSCSKILKWDNYSKDINNKNVDDIQVTQNSIVNNLGKFINDKNIYILDGHFALLSTSKIIEEIPMYVYKEINPLIIFVLTLEPRIIVSRLKKRDCKTYSEELIKEFQEKELNNAFLVGKSLGINVFEINNLDIDKTINLINDVLKRVMI